MQSLFREDVFASRTKLSYGANCLEIEYAETETKKSELQKNHVTNKGSFLANLRDFDITTQLPQDIMHTLLEESVQYKLRNLLWSYSKSKDFTLEELIMRSLILLLVIVRLGINLDLCMSPSPLAMRDINLNIMLLNQNCSWDYFPIYSLILSIKHLHIIRF